MQIISNTSPTQTSSVGESALCKIQEVSQRAGLDSNVVLDCLGILSQRQVATDQEALKVLKEAGAIRLISTDEFTRMGEVLKLDTKLVSDASTIPDKMRELEKALEEARASGEAARQELASPLTIIFGYKYSSRSAALNASNQREESLLAELNALDRERKELSVVQQQLGSRAEYLARYIPSGEWHCTLTGDGLAALECRDSKKATPEVGLVLPPSEYSVKRFGDVIANAVVVPELKPRVIVESVPEQSTPQQEQTNNSRSRGNGRAMTGAQGEDPADEALRIVATNRDADSVNQLIEIVGPRFTANKLEELVRGFWEGNVLPVSEVVQVLNTHARRFGTSLAPIVRDVAESLVDDDSATEAATLLSEHSEAFTRNTVPVEILAQIAGALGDKYEKDAISNLLSSFGFVLSPDKTNTIFQEVWGSDLGIDSCYALATEKMAQLGPHFAGILESVIEYQLDNDSLEDAHKVILEHPLVIAKARWFPGLATKVINALGDKDDLSSITKIVGALVPYVSSANLVKLIDAALDSSLDVDDCKTLVGEFKAQLGPSYPALASKLFGHLLDNEDFEGALDLLIESSTSLRGDPTFTEKATELAKHFGEAEDKDSIGKLIGGLIPYISRKKIVEFLTAAVDAGLPFSDAEELADTYSETLRADMAPFATTLIRGYLDDGSELENAEKATIRYGAVLPKDNLSAFVKEIGEARNDEDELDELETFLQSLATSVSSQKLVASLDAIKEADYLDKRTFRGIVSALTAQLGEGTLRRLCGGDGPRPRS